jgi:hypothetical protein
MPAYKMGKRPAAHDPRIPSMPSRVNLSALPPPPASINWYAAQASSGVPLLGNGTYGDCVPCSVAHFIGAISRYANPSAPLIPTEAETLAIYSAVTGFDPNDPSTDQGTTFLGQGGMVDHWARHGVTIGGQLNKPHAVVTIDHLNPVRIQQAISLFGFVFCGAQMRQADMDSDFMWRPSATTVVGGHEFLICGLEHVAGSAYYDVLTWDGMWRASGDWIAQSVDEMAAVLDMKFIGANGIDPAGVNVAALEHDMRAIAA